MTAAGTRPHAPSVEGRHRVRPLGIEGAWVDTPRAFTDRRGRFHEWFRADRFREATGHALRLEQANCSRSMRGALRGIHYASVPPGQAKYVTCISGAVLDVVVDIRTGSRPSAGGRRSGWTTMSTGPSTSRRAWATPSWPWRRAPPWSTSVPRDMRRSGSSVSTPRPGAGDRMAHGSRSRTLGQGRRGSHPGGGRAAGPAALPCGVRRIPAAPEGPAGRTPGCGVAGVKRARSGARSRCHRARGTVVPHPALIKKSSFPAVVPARQSIGEPCASL